MGKKKTEIRKGTRAKDITLKAGEAAALRGGAWYAKLDGVDGTRLQSGPNDVFIGGVKKK